MVEEAAAVAEAVAAATASSHNCFGNVDLGPKERHGLHFHPIANGNIHNNCGYKQLCSITHEEVNTYGNFKEIQ